MKYFNWKTMLRVILTEEGKFTQKNHIKACYSILMHSHCAFGRLYRSLKNAATKNKTFWVSTTYIKWNDFCSDHGTWLTSNTITGSKWWPLCFHFLHLHPFPGGFVSLFSRKQVLQQPEPEPWIKLLLSVWLSDFFASAGAATIVYIHRDIFTRDASIVLNLQKLWAESMFCNYKYPAFVFHHRNRKWTGNGDCSFVSWLPQPK